MTARERQLARQLAWWRRRYADPAFRAAYRAGRRTQEDRLKDRLRRARRKTG